MTGTTKDEAGSRFRTELRRAMTIRGIGPADLARRLGCTPGHVQNWRRGGYLPTHANVLRLADALSWDGLVEISIEARTTRCEVCDAAIFDPSKERGRRRYCGTRCQRVGYDRRHDLAKAEDLTLLRNRLRERNDAIERHCRRCSDGFCPERDRVGQPGACDLIEVSPYWRGSTLPTPLHQSPTVKLRRTG